LASFAAATTIISNPEDNKFIFGLNRAENTKDFLSTYFRSKDPRPFENL